MPNPNRPLIGQYPSGVADWGAAISTVSLACAGHATVTDSVLPVASRTITTGWSGTCSSLTIGASNGRDTNFKNLVLGGG